MYSVKILKRTRCIFFSGRMLRVYKVRWKNMCLFDEFLAWKKETSKPNEFEIYIYQHTEEIMDIDTAEFLNEKYTLHKQNNGLAKI